MRAPHLTECLDEILVQYVQSLVFTATDDIIPPSTVNTVDGGFVLHLNLQVPLNQAYPELFSFPPSFRCPLPLAHDVELINGRIPA